MSAALMLATAGPVRAAEPVYAALGDSYASGVGTRDYIDDDSDCLRSTYAYPWLTAERLGAQLRFAACVGAEIDDVWGQLDQLDAGTDYVTVQVGGNDAGFTDVLVACAQPWPTTCWDEIDAANDYIDNELPDRLDTLYTGVADEAADAEVAVVGYPRLFNGERCNLAARISPEEQAELNATADALSATIQDRADAHGFGYVDAVPAFIGHSVCDDEEWLNGLSNPIRESYHPNRVGQIGYTDLVADVLAG